MYAGFSTSKSKQLVEAALEGKILSQKAYS